MKTLREFSEYYYRKHIYVFPNTKVFDWKNDWREYTQTVEDVQQICWEEAKQVYGVAGKKGVRVIKFMHIDNLRMDVIYPILKTALFILHLPQDYPWIILTPESISIVVESADDIQGMKNRSYSGRKDFGIGMTILLWQADFLLPSFDSRVGFIGKLPESRPLHVHNSHIFECIDVFRDSIILHKPEDVLGVLKV